MSDQLTLPAEARDRAGKGASRALRRDGRVPAVVYGEKKEPLSIHVEEKLLTQDAFDRPLHELGRDDRLRGQAAPHAAEGGRFPPGHAAGRSTSISCASASTPRCTSRCRCASTMKTLRRASSAAACSTSSSTSSRSSATRRASRTRSTSRSTGWRSAIRSTSARSSCLTASSRRTGRGLHRRHHRRSVGDEGRRGRGARPMARSRPSRARKAKAAKAAKRRGRRRARRVSASGLLRNCRNRSPAPGRAVSFCARAHC